MRLPYLVCLCPTYRRPRLLENAIAQFEAQDYPADRRRLLILEDAGEIPDQSGDGWQLRSVSRYASLPAKYNALAHWAWQSDAEAIVVWEDDDVYLPWHLSATALALETSEWSKPSVVWTLCGPTPIQEPGDGRFHASIAVRMRYLISHGGWPLTDRADYDLQFMGKLRESGAPGDPCRFAPPSYVFRWASTGSPHAQGFGRGPQDTEWWQRAGQALPPQPTAYLAPRLDDETAHLYELLRPTATTESVSESSP